MRMSGPPTLLLFVATNEKNLGKPRILEGVLKSFWRCVFGSKNPNMAPGGSAKKSIYKS